MEVNNVDFEEDSSPFIYDAHADIRSSELGDAKEVSLLTVKILIFWVMDLARAK